MPQFQEAGVTPVLQVRNLRFRKVEVICPRASVCMLPKSFLKGRLLLVVLQGALQAGGWRGKEQSLSLEGKDNLIPHFGFSSFFFFFFLSLLSCWSLSCIGWSLCTPCQEPSPVPKLPGSHCLSEVASHGPLAANIYYAVLLSPHFLSLIRYRLLACPNSAQTNVQSVGLISLFFHLPFWNSHFLPIWNFFLSSMSYTYTQYSSQDSASATFSMKSSPISFAYSRSI